MYLLADIGGSFTGDKIYQLSLLAILLGVIILIIALFIFVKKRNSRLKRIEEKLDKHTSNKDDGKP